jgi:rubredoxin
VAAYRCRACGNRTRFDVVRTSTVREFHHFTLDGSVDVQVVDVIEDRVDSVTCRWCGHGKDVVSLERP